MSKFTTKITLPNLLQGYTDRHDLSQRAFAKRLGISQPALNYIIQAKQFPSLKLIRKIAEVTGIDVREILLADVETKMKIIEGGNANKI